MVGKPRYALVLAAHSEARLCAGRRGFDHPTICGHTVRGQPVSASVVAGAKLHQHPKHPAVKFTEFVRKAPGNLDARVMSDVAAALKRWLKL